MFCISRTVWSYKNENFTFLASPKLIFRPQVDSMNAQDFAGK